MNVAIHPSRAPSINVLSLCAGVGGLELGIQLALAYRGKVGRGICFVEREAAAAASLVASMEAGWFHPAPVWSDMLTFDGRPWRGLVHILASGDPCQDNSVAGKRAGSDGERFLAPEVCRIADECRPDLIFRENVPGNADGQLAAIIPPLERLGYRVAAGIFSSAETGNSMRRERLFIMAERVEGAGSGRHRDEDQALRAGRHGSLDAGGSVDGPEGNGRGKGRTQPARQQGRPDAGFSGGPADVGLAPGSELQGQRDGYPSAGQRSLAGRHAPLPSRTTFPPAVIPGPTDSRWFDVLDRFPELQPALSEAEAESHLRRGIDAMANRIERLRATGNGVDPVVAAYAFLRLSALHAAEAGRAADESFLREQVA